MFFTGQRLIAGQQAIHFAGSRSSLPASQSAPSYWQYVTVSELAGTRSALYCMPGSPMPVVMSGSKPGSKTTAQFHLTMKNVRKQQDTAIGQHRTGVSNLIAPPDNFDESGQLENTIFAEKQAHRKPESPEEESFRSLLKANLPRHKASPALLLRIKNSIQLIQE
jgi:hypothetical protein